MSRARSLQGWAARSWRGLSARPWSSLALLITGVLTVAAATLGPLYARAAQESVLHSALVAAPITATGLQVTVDTSLDQAAQVAQAVASAPRAGFVTFYPTRQVGLRVNTMAQSAVPGAPNAQNSYLAARDGECAHLVMVSGRCPAAAGEAILSARTLDTGYLYRVGTRILLPDLTTSGGKPSSLLIVGTYRPVDPADPFWFGRNYFNAALSTSDSVPDTIDAVFVTRSTFAKLGTVAGTVDVDYPLDPSAVRLSDVAGARKIVATTLASATGASVYTDPLPSVLSGNAQARHQVAVGSLLVSLQLVALALVVLFLITGDVLQARGGDVALAKLRGLTPRATLALLLGETTLLLVISLPLGGALGVGLAHVLAHLLLVPGVPVAVPVAAGLAAAAGFVGGLVAAAGAGRRTLTRSVLEQWNSATSRTEQRRRPWLLDALVVLAAAAGIGLLASGTKNIATLVAPGLLVVAVALLGVRVLPVLIGRALPRSRGSSRLGPFIALRLVGRRPAALRLAAVLAVAIGLAVFGVAGESVASGNRLARAHLEVGAPRTVTVQFNPRDDPLALVDKADPDGRWAMLTAQWLPDGGGTVIGTMLGIDPSRLTTVAYPTTQGASLSTIQHAIDPATPAPVLLRGTTVRVHVDAVTSTAAGRAPIVTLLLEPATGGAVSQVPLGVLRPGTAAYTGPVSCSNGCRLIGFAWGRPLSDLDPITRTATVTGVDVASGGTAFTPVDLTLGTPGAWIARTPDGTDAAVTTTVTVSDTGIKQTFTSTSGSTAAIQRVSIPSLVPVWAADGSVLPPAVRPPGPAAIQDGIGVSLPLTIVGTDRVVPGVGLVAPGTGSAGVIANVAWLNQSLPSFAAEATWSVWLGPQAPADAVTRLAAAGLQPGAVTTTSQRVETLSKQGPALALALLLACAAAAAVLAAGATATSIAATGRRRTFELAALRVLGVTRRSLRTATVLEQLTLLGTALVLGVPTGLVAAIVAMPAIPQFSDRSPLRLTDSPALGQVLAVAGALLVLLVVVAVAAGTSLARSADPSRLRETAE